MFGRSRKGFRHRYHLLEGAVQRDGHQAGETEDAAWWVCCRCLAGERAKPTGGYFLTRYYASAHDHGCILDVLVEFTKSEWEEFTHGLNIEHDLL